MFFKKYHVDYSGSKRSYKNAKDSYRAGKTVTLYYPYIATDTNYSFYLEGAELEESYVEGKGFKLSFVMPAHDVRLECRSRNTMVFDPSEMMNMMDMTDLKM